MAGHYLNKGAQRQEYSMRKLELPHFEMQVQRVLLVAGTLLATILLPNSAAACGQKLTLKKVACYVFEGDLECKNIGVIDEKQCVINIKKSGLGNEKISDFDISLKNINQELIRQQKFPKNSTPVFRISGPKILRKTNADGTIKTTDNYNFALKGDPETTMLGLEHIFRFFCST